VAASRVQSVTWSVSCLQRNKENLLQIEAEFPTELKTEGLLLSNSNPYPTLPVFKAKLFLFSDNFMTHLELADISKQPPILGKRADFPVTGGPNNSTQSTKKARYGSIHKITTEQELYQFPKLTQSFAEQSLIGHNFPFVSKGKMCLFDPKCPDPTKAVSIFRVLMNK
jgi:hypothetical protein